MLSKDAASLTGAQISTKATTYFQALFNRPEANNLAIVATYTTDRRVAAHVTASAQRATTTFMKVMGISQLNVGTSLDDEMGQLAAARRAGARQHRIDGATTARSARCKTATNNLLNQLKAAATNNGDVYVSIVPFSEGRQRRRVNYNADLDRLDRLGGRAALQQDGNKPSNWDQHQRGRQLSVCNVEPRLWLRAEPDEHVDDSRPSRRAAPMRATSAPAPTRATRSRRRAARPTTAATPACRRRCTTRAAGARAAAARPIARARVAAAARSAPRPTTITLGSTNSAQHLERLRHRPRQLRRAEFGQLRHQRRRADHQHRDAVLCRTIRLLPAGR